MHDQVILSPWQMTIRNHRTIVIAFGMVLAVLIVVALDLWVFRPSGVYSYKSGAAFGFEIGMTKKQVFHRINSSSGGVCQIRTRSPSEMQDPIDTGSFRYTTELAESDYWILYRISAPTVVLSFRNGRIQRILGHVRRFGELETSLSMFSNEDDRDLFKGLSQEEIDRIVIKERTAVRVFLY